MAGLPSCWIATAGHNPTAPSASSAPASPLGPAWAEVLGVDHLAATSNDWQAFSALEALARARDAGVVVDARQVTRHRTLAGLDRDPANASPGSSWFQVAADDR